MWTDSGSPTVGQAMLMGGHTMESIGPPLQAADCWVGSGRGDRSAAHDSQLRQLWGVQERREAWDGRLAPSQGCEGSPEEVTPT